ncbi:HK97 gp10 family phage protein [Cereibacter azotoformans]|uniref:HK97 gp10 family phage protein n=1 Tax=Cereibacter azotoformans TaxID=43057 RepID=A0A2T5JLK3_9RHOB|nr:MULTISPECIES: HK97-gp10 family putative phage morphogenesis protein [Cereibacter]AXQ95119.1 HK97 gp10 family phage protein [Cereibacter sphaeroides]PTR07780.1 HK97 gp10 family phage protein [Cereibacter azotoformans]UIJ29541.1 HK97 gp10 family phage protein [Cereibacter azotoformans]
MADDGGLGKFQRRMRAVPKAAREAVQPALVRQAEALASTMRAVAPKDSGDLAGSIAVTGPGQTTPAYSQPGGAMMVGENQSAVTVGNSDVRYAHLVEYGTTKNEAKPFFWPSVRLHRARAAAAIKRAIGKAIREAGR